MPTKQELIDECTHEDGKTNSDIARRFGLSSNQSGSRLAEGVRNGWLYKVRGNIGDVTRYFGSMEAANAFQRSLVTKRRIQSAATPAPADPPAASTATKIFMATPRGDSPWFKKCPPDRDVVSRPGANDFRSIPSLSPFHTGAVR